jgi:hypothetical protein
VWEVGNEVYGYTQIMRSNYNSFRGWYSVARAVKSGGLQKGLRGCISSFQKGRKQNVYIIAHG